jgi:hypothetical protein
MAAGSPGSNDLVYLPGVTAGLTLAAKQYAVVKFASTANAVVAVTATTDAAVGIVQNDPAAGEAALVAISGVAIGIAGVNDLAAGELVGFNTTGQVVDHTTDNRRIIGQALDASTAVGDYVRVKLVGLSRY